MELIILIMYVFSSASLLIAIYLWYEVKDLQSQLTQLRRPTKPRVWPPAKPVIKVARKPGYWD